jgi:hypothetical protein
MAATVNYQWPVANTTVAPTQAQSNYLVKGTLNWLDADTTVTITHNFNLSAADVTALFPDVDLVIDSTNTGTGLQAGTIAVASAANTVTLTKVSAAGTGGTWRFSLDKWHSITR